MNARDGNIMTHWSETEVSYIVSDYFSMLLKELFGKKYNKTEHRKKLKPLLHNRTDGSIERKHQNISAVMIEMGLPYIAGYKPLRNYQRSVLPEVINDFLISNESVTTSLTKHATEIPKIPTVDDILQSLVPSPDWIFQ
jgi:hypothetical protein